MATHAYCLLIGHERPPASIVGLDDAAVRAIIVDDVCMWVSDAPEAATKVTLERVQRHNDVVSAALETGTTPVPMRYGQHFESDQHARIFVAEKLPALRRLFARVDGMVEMSVVVAPAMKKTLRDLETLPPSALAASQRGAGLRYLRYVREKEMREQRARSIIESHLDRVSAAVGDLAHGEERQAQQRGIGTVAHLIPRSAVTPYRERVRAISVEDWQLLLNGPRAPYSFCSIGGEDDRSGTVLAT